MAANTDTTIDELRAEVASLKKDLGNVADTIKKLSGETVEQGREQLRRTTRRSRDQAKEALSALESEIEERPVTSLAAAFGIGFIVGKLFDR